MKKIFRTLLLSSIIIGLANCQKDLSYSNENTTPIVPITSPIVASIQGVVVDENGLPANGATVNVGGKTTTTNTIGFFRLTNTNLDKLASVVKVEKSGYFMAYRTFQATAGSNHVGIKLIKKEMVGTVASSAGGTVTLSNGSTILLPSNGVIKKTGEAFSGTVNVYAAYIDPTKNDIAQTVPGSFMADDKNGKRVILKSYGMLAVELESAAGEKLQIATDKTAQLTAPIPTLLLATAPASIALWYVDEQTGIWKEQGSATKVGNNYVGNVSHFSYWNYDGYLPAITLTCTIKNPNGIPLVNTNVSIIPAVGYGGSGHGFTDSEGKISGLVAANQNLIMQVYDNCGNVVYSQNIGPFSQNVNLGDVIANLTYPTLLTISGKLITCDGTPVTNGTAIVFFGNFPTYINTNNIGDFSLSFIRCTSNPLSVDITGVDNITQQQGLTNHYTITNANLNVGAIVACGTSSTQFINYTLDGNNFSIISTDAASTFTGYTNNYNNSFYSTISASQSFNIATLSFTSNAMVNGIYDLSNIYVNNVASNTFTAPSKVTITNFPQQANEFYEGNFTANFSVTDSATSQTSLHAATGVFRIRRQ
jgi:hypothetical protein